MDEVLKKYFIGETKIIITLGIIEDKAKPFLKQAVSLIQKSINQNKKFLIKNTKEFVVAIDEPILGAAKAYGLERPSPNFPNIRIGMKDWIIGGRLNQKKFFGVLVHEFRHLIDTKENKNYKLMSEARSRLELVMRRIQALINVASPSWEEFRIIYSCLLDELMLEGLARFVEYALPLNSANFKKLYARALKKQGKLHPFTKVYLESLRGRIVDMNDFEKMLNFRYTIQRASCDIGHHMVYTIRFMFPQVRLENFISMSTYQFIKLYEQACTKAIIRPVVSLTSGNGYFDYNKTIKELYVIFSKASKKGKRYLRACPNCSAKVPYNARFCPNCKYKFE